MAKTTVIIDDELLHEAMKEVDKRVQTGEEAPSPVAVAIERKGLQVESF